VIVHVTLVHVQVKPERLEDFIRVTRTNHEGAVREPGNLRFDLLQEAADPGRFIIYEAYASEADAIAHKGTDHYLAWRSAVAEMMAAPRQGVAYRGLLPEG
jgi:(4S)-4-hydroxy-5-phosphonooxypentane-2,3-dione isomerase